MNILVVDGYNIIGSWPMLRTLRDTDLSAARDLLIAKMAEYKAYSGDRVIVVFDAYFVRGIEKKYRLSEVEIVFTRENETADERIEKLIKKLKKVKTDVYVATSDSTEQSNIFGQGALRKSARELLIEMEEVEHSISKQVRQTKEHTPTTKIPLKEDVLAVFEKWRRGQK